MKILNFRNKKEERKDEYQRVIEKFGTEQLKKLADKGLRLPVAML